MKLLVILFTIFIIFAFIVVFAWVFVNVFGGYLRYEEKMEYLENLIITSKITPENYNFIFDEFMDMNKLIYNNKDRTAKLFDKFLKRYKV